MAAGIGLQGESGTSSTDVESGFGSVANALPTHSQADVAEKEQDKARQIVGWDGDDDVECPRNWPRRKKVLFAAATSSMILSVSFGSSTLAPAATVMAEEFHVAVIVMRLGVAFWILGLSAGPIFFGPLSEIFGHLAPYWISICGMLLFQIPVAVGENVWTILICRFFGGAFGSGSMAVVSGMYFELFGPIDRGAALGLSSTCITLGATIAPIAGSYLSNDVSWRWTAWVTLMLVGLSAGMNLVAVRESSSGKILSAKAKRLRLATGNWALHAESEERAIRLDDILHRYLTKPVRMLVSEPILIILTSYLTLVYGTLYLSFQAFPIAYQQRGFSATASSLPFVAVTLGILSALGLWSVFALTWYKHKALASEASPLPEYRLPPMMAGAAMLPPALLWFAWSGNVHWMSQVMAGYLIGLALMLIFIAGIVYIVDVYQSHANSAMSIHVVVRSLVASSFPLWADIMYARLGVSWASSLLAFLTLVMTPAPLVFYLYGGRIRSWSRFRPT